METVVAALHCVASAAVLALALSSGRSFFAGAAVVTRAAGLTQTAAAEAMLLLLGWLLAGLAAGLWSALCLLSLAVAAKGSGRALVVALALAAATGLALVALSGSPFLVALYCLATSAVAVAARCCLPQTRLALAALRTALLALLQLPQLLPLAAVVLGAYAAWLAVWVVAALGLAAAAQEEVFTTDGSVFSAEKCVVHSFAQATEAPPTSDSTPAGHRHPRQAHLLREETLPPLRLRR